MRFLIRNLHVFVFALVSVLSAIYVSHNPKETQRHLRPLVEDAVELKELAQGASRAVAGLDLEAASSEAVSLFVATMRMPTLLFERLAEKLDAVEKELNQRKRAKALGVMETGRVYKADVSILLPEPGDGPVAGPRSSWI